MSAPDAAAVRDALLAAGEPDPGEVSIEPVLGGASRDIWALRGEGSPRYVLRRDQPGEPPLTSREAEFAVQRAAHAARVPVPRPICFEPAGGRFETAGMVMEWVEGESIARRLLRDDAFEPARARLAEQLGEALGRLRYADVGAVASVLPPAEDPLVTAREQLDRAGEALPAVELGLRWLELNRPPPRPPAIVHGDFRLGNFMIAPQGLVAVIDWEFTHLGDPHVDLAWVSLRPWRFGNDDRAVAGIGALRDLIAGFERASGEEVDRDRLRWCAVLGHVNWAGYCALQARRWTDGEHRDLERLVLGRRVCEAEWDLLALIEGG